MTRSARADERSGPAQLVLGTAGHIDHGKTALVRALTGVDTDRLPEERTRGITIELGFADLALDDGRRVSVIDVPGHERLVRTMISGASGIDAVLLAVAADEGVMPQTREHVAICDLLGLERCVVALTKVDLVDDETCEMAAAEVAELLATTGLEASALVPVSVRDGRGIGALRTAIGRALDESDHRTARGGPPRLSIDRVFGVRGFGAVVTGTLVGGALRVGDEVEVAPGGRRARVRGLQRHGTEASRVEPGTRCAVNLQGLEVSDLERGQTLTAPGALLSTSRADVALRWIPGARPGAERLAVEVVAGAASRRGRLWPIGGAHFDAAGGFGRLHVEGAALPLRPGDRLVLRGFSRGPDGGRTLGGAVVLDAAPPRRSRRDPRVLEDLRAFASGDASAGLAARVGRSGLEGRSLADLAAESGLEPSDVRARLDDLERSGALEGLGGDRWIACGSLERLEDALAGALAAFHAAEPLRPGMPLAALRGSLPSNVPAAAVRRAIERLVARGALIVEGEIARRPEHAPVVDDESAGLLGRILEDASAQGLEPPGARDWAARLGVELGRFRDLAAHLEREGRLVRAPGELWFDAGAIEGLRSRVLDHLRRHRELPTPVYKKLIGTPRRTAVPLMELFDDQRLTRRRGEVRVLHGTPGDAAD